MQSRPIHPFACREMRWLPQKARSQAAAARRDGRYANASRNGERVTGDVLRGIEVTYIEPEVIVLR